MDFNQFLSDFQDIVNRLDSNYKKLYTSRVNPELVSNVVVQAYGSDMKLSEVANINIPQARTIVIKPYDVSTIEDILKGLQKQKPEFSPIVQSDHLKIVLNPPTEETRKKTVKEAKEFLEQAKVGVRNLRKEYLDKLKKEELSEDLEKKESTKIDQEVKKMNSKLEELFAAKEKELMTI